MLHGIMFHHFHDGIDHISCQGSLDKEMLSDLIDYYEKEYRIVSSDEFKWEIDKGNWHRNKVCLTFDDTLKSQYDVALSVLKDRGLTCFFNVNTVPLEGKVLKLEEYHHFRFKMFDAIDDYYDAFFEMVEKESKRMNIESSYLDGFSYETFKPNSPFYTYNDKKYRYLRDVVLGEEKYDLIMGLMMQAYDYNVDEYRDTLWLSLKDILELSDLGNTIGLHSHSHPTMLSLMSYSSQYFEFSKNKCFLENAGIDIDSASYPCNEYNDCTLKVMEQLNINYGFAANMTTVGLNSSLEIPRLNHTYILKAMKHS